MTHVPKIKSWVDEKYEPINLLYSIEEEENNILNSLNTMGEFNNISLVENNDGSTFVINGKNEAKDVFDHSKFNHCGFNGQDKIIVHFETKSLGYFPFY